MGKKSGILLHIATLPSGYGIGSLGKKAYEFVDFLVSAGQAYWQVLPLVPTGYGDSPYQSGCSYAVNEYFIDLPGLFERGLLTGEELKGAETEEDSRIDYENLFLTRVKLLKKAFARLSGDEGFTKFLESGEYREYAVFRAIKEVFGFKEFSLWPKEYKYRDPDAMAAFEKEHERDILFYEWTQYEFLSEWKALKKYANDRGIKIIGDIPIYVCRDSVECWTEPELFKLDKERRPVTVAGCPPDYFSADGQLWGNPIYNYGEMKKDGYAWWKNRMEKTCRLFDAVKIDHFRGFDRFYEIPAKDKTAANGKWVKGPSDELFRALKNVIGSTEIIAEDLGELDESCRAMLKRTGYPGMKVLSFAFDSDETNAYLPSNYVSENCIVYTGTHDNDTLMGLISSKIDPKSFAEKVAKELKRNGLFPRGMEKEEIADDIIDLTLASKGNVAVIPLQDWVYTGSEGRINYPSTLSTKNWSYRVPASSFDTVVADKIRERCLRFGRTPE